eukprot:457798_1
MDQYITHSVPAHHMNIPSKDQWYICSGCSFQPPNNNTLSTTTDSMHVHLGLHGLISGDELNTILQNPIRQNIERYKSDKDFFHVLQDKLYDKFINNAKYRNKIYTLFIHTVTHPNSPQIWRRIRVSSKLTLKQFELVLKNCIGFGNTHSTEFQIPIQSFCEKEIVMKEPSPKLHKGKLCIWDYEKVHHFIDSKVWDYLRSTMTIKMDQIIFGQIADLFPIKNDFKDKYPFDAFHQKYFNDNKHFEILEKLSPNFEMRFDNFNYHRNDCLHWIYDIGNLWNTHIYIEDVQILDNRYKNKIMCEYINGSTYGPPTNIGDFEQWHLCLLKSMGLWEERICSFDTGNDIYEWLQETELNYYEMICLAKDSCSKLMKKYDFSKLKKKYSSQEIFNKTPKWNVYFDINPMMEGIISLINKKLRKINSKTEMKRRIYNLQKQRVCANCQSFSNRLKTCSKCKMSWYCSKKCQKIAWKKFHKLHCD